MLNEFVYCPRLFHLEHVQGLFRESADTVKGSYQHKRSEADRPKVRRKAGAKDAPPPEEPSEQTTLFTKNLALSSEELGITGKLDAVEEEGEHWAPVENKHSAGPSGDKPFEVEGRALSGEAWPNDQIQLCAQALLLRSHGLRSEFGYIYYRAAKKRVKIELTNDLIEATRTVIRRARELENKSAPAPLVDSPKCIRCSLNAFCLPDEINRLAGRMGEPRRIIPGRDDAGVLYVITQGAHVSKRGESIVIEANGKKVDEIPFKDISHAALFGHIQISTEALHLFLAAQRTVSFFSAGGKLLGVAAAPIAKNVRLRVIQYRSFEDPVKALALSRGVVQAKIENQRTLLRRNGKGLDGTLKAMKEMSDACAASADAESLRGREGKAGQVYFASWPGLLARRDEPKDGQGTFAQLDGANDWEAAREDFFKMDGRNRRPPKDPVNAMLSFGYTLLGACPSNPFSDDQRRL
jgi:CRISPR-associated protein Cas1